jgi:CubicO group peptidase (beta-lactamase class C family)
MKSLLLTFFFCLGISSCYVRTYGQDASRIASKRSEAFEAEIRGMIETAIAENKMPGCVVGVGNSSGLIYQKAFGNRSLDPVSPMTLDTVFDMASITKPVSTATSILQLIEKGKLRL